MLERLLSDKKVTLKYLHAGLDIADYYAAKWQYSTYEHLKLPREQAFSRWEREYARRGFVTLPLEVFHFFRERHFNVQGAEQMIDDEEVKPLIRLKRPRGAPPVYYAEKEGYDRG